MFIQLPVAPRFAPCVVSSDFQTTPEEKIGIGTVDTIESIVEENNLKNPAIILLGEVVNHRQSIKEVQHLYADDLRGLI